MVMYIFVPPFREATFCGVPSCVFDKSGCAAGEKRLRNTGLKKSSVPSARFTSKNSQRGSEILTFNGAVSIHVVAEVELNQTKVKKVRMEGRVTNSFGLVCIHRLFWRPESRKISRFIGPQIGNSSVYRIQQSGWIPPFYMDEGRSILGNVVVL
jgi:hypothetical protein